MDMKASNPARRHALARTFRFEKTKFILYHLVLEYLQLGQVLVNGSSRLSCTYCKGSEHGFEVVQGFKCSVVQQPALYKTAKG
jgi:hypothetical protein